MDDPIGKFLGKNSVTYHVKHSAFGEDPRQVLLVSLIPNPCISIDRR